MRSAQQLIKVFAIVLAMLLIVGIFGAIIGGVSLLAAVTGAEVGEWVGDTTGPWTSENYEPKTVRELEMNVKTTSVEFRMASEGEAVRVETNNEYITTWVDEDSQRLNVIEKSHGILGWGGRGEVIVYVREDVKFDQVRLEIGAGTLDIEQLNTRTLDLNLGAGKTEIRGLRVDEHVEIDGGAGLLVIRNAELKDARIKLGVGKAVIRAKLMGDSKIDAGVGKVEFDLVGREQDYRLRIDKGIGSVELNGVKMQDGSVWGTGKNAVDIESGVGAVEIKVVED